MVLGGFVRTTTAASLLVLATGMGAVVYSPPPSLVGFFGVLLVGVGFGAFAVTLFAILSAWSPEARPAQDDAPAAGRPTEADSGPLSGSTSGPNQGPTPGPTEEFVRGGSGGTIAPITAAGQVEVEGSSSPLEALESTLESDEEDHRATEASTGDDDPAASRDETGDGEEADRDGDHGGADDEDTDDEDTDDEGEEADEGGFVWASHRPDDHEPTPDRGRSNGGNEVLDATGDRAELEVGRGAAADDEGGVQDDEGVPLEDEKRGIDDGGMEAETEADVDADHDADEDAGGKADLDTNEEADEDGDESPDEDDFLWDDPSDR